MQSNGEVAFRLTILPAPTWSWASVEGKIEYRVVFENPRVLIKILDANVIPVTGCNTGRVKDGALTMQARLLKWFNQDFGLGSKGKRIKFCSRQYWSRYDQETQIGLQDVSNYCSLDYSIDDIIS